MADLGILSLNIYPTFQVRPAAHWRDFLSLGGYVSQDASGTLSGTVDIGGSPVANAEVTLYYRPTKRFINYKKTLSDGTYQFTGLDINDLSNYFVVFQTDDAGNYNAIVRDKLTAE